MHDVKAIDVLLVEDDPGDVLMTREAFKDNKLANRLSVVPDGVDAMAYLRKEGRFADSPTPDLVLLDLNLPRMDGREVLAAMKSDPELRRIPVVVLTTSEAEEDVLRSYSLHANAYVATPVDFGRFLEVVAEIDDDVDAVVRWAGRWPESCWGPRGCHRQVDRKEGGRWPTHVSATPSKRISPVSYTHLTLPTNREV